MTMNTRLYNQFRSEQAVKTLSSAYDGSKINRIARENAKHYLTGLCATYKLFADRKPESKCAIHLYKMIDYYMSLVNQS